MPSTRVIGILIVAAMAVPAVGLPDWKGDLARKTVGRAAREGPHARGRDLAGEVSLVNRELTFPNQREAGLDAGKGLGPIAEPTRMRCDSICVDH